MEKLGGGQLNQWKNSFIYNANIHNRFTAREDPKKSKYR